MTWSVVALDPDSGQLAVAVSSKFFAVGAVCPYLCPRVGALSTQSQVNPYLGVQACAMMRAGASAPAAMKAAIAADARPEARQLHGIDVAGNIGAFSGPQCIDWAGQVHSKNVSVAGNTLAGAGVINDTLAAYLDNQDKPFAERLLHAMTAGEIAGGDKRGRQAAALKIVGDEDYALLDLRVDDHPNPIAELWRLYQVAHERSLARTALMPTRKQPVDGWQYENMEVAVKSTLAGQQQPDFSAEIARLEALPSP